MATEILVRLHDGPGGREAGQFLTPRPYPFPGYSQFEKTGMSQRYARVVILDKDPEEVATIIGRHTPVLFNAKGEVISSLRSAVKLHMGVLRAVDHAAIQARARVMKNWLDIGLLDGRDNSVVVR